MNRTEQAHPTHACPLAPFDRPFPFTMAFQPIVDVEAGTIYAYEALVRGPKGESAQTVLEQITPENCVAFDQTCRLHALHLAAKLGLPATGARLSINFTPGAVYSPTCIESTLEAAAMCGLPHDRLIFEVTETEEVRDRHHLNRIVAEFRRHGFRIAIDDFGAGNSGLNLLADLRSDILKLDMELTRNLHSRPAAHAIVRSLVQLCMTLGIQLVAEGIETVTEYITLRAAGIRLMQGYLLARPGFECLPDVRIPAMDPVLMSTPLAGSPYILSDSARRSYLI